MNKRNWENEFPEVPEHIHSRILETLSGLDDMEGKKMKKTYRKRSKKRVFLLTAALILLLGTTAAAAGIAVRGHIFERLAEKYPYHGLEETDRELLAETTEAENKEETVDPYVVTQDGLTITLSEMYATNQAIFIGVCVENEKEFPALASFEGEGGYQALCFWTEESYSFRPDNYKGMRLVKGELIDPNTFIGVLRIDYSTINVDGRAYDLAVKEAEANGQEIPGVTAETWDTYFSYYEIPKQYTCSLTVGKVGGYPKEWEQEGSWAYELNIREDTSHSREIEINEMNEDGIGIASVALSKVELSVEEICPTDRLTFVVALDAEGRKLPVGGTNANQFAIQNRDIGTVYLYVCDYEEYMDEIKAHAAKEDFQEVLKKRALFETVVDTGG